MNKIIIAGLMLACLCVNSLRARAEVVYVKAGHLISATNGKVTQNAVIKIDGERIVEVGQEFSDIPTDATVIDLSDRYLLPGVMDMHTHIPGHLDRYYFAGYFQSPHRAVIGGGGQRGKNPAGRIHNGPQCRCSRFSGRSTSKRY